MAFDFRRRLRDLQSRMEQLDVEVAVYGSCQNLQYLTGLLIDWRHGVDLGNAANNVFVPMKGEPILTLARDFADQVKNTWIRDVRISESGETYGKLVKEIITSMRGGEGNIALGDHVWGSTVAHLSKLRRRIRFLPGGPLMARVRVIKDFGEIERLRKAAELTDRVVEKTVPRIKRGVTQKELGLTVEFEGKLLGASDVSFPPTVGFVKSGSEISPNPFTYPAGKGLISGSSIAFDVGFVLDGYCSDFGRSFYYGPASIMVKEAYEALQQSVVEVVDDMYDGSMRVCDVFPHIEKTLDRLGYGNYLRARLPTGNVGQSIGVEVHEPPWLSPTYDETLQAGMVMALEPKLWHAGQYYLRVEDIVLVGHRKSEFLTNFDRELFQL